MSSSSGVSTLSVTGIYSVSISTTDSASFIITSILNPISTATISGFTFLIVDSSNDSYEIASKTTGITMKVNTAKIMASLSNTPPSSFKVLNEGIVLFSMAPGIEIETGCRMHLSIPPETR